MERQEKVLTYLSDNQIPFTCYNHPEGKTIEEAKRWWKDDGSVHCKNIFIVAMEADQIMLIAFVIAHEDILTMYATIVLPPAFSLFNGLTFGMVIAGKRYLIIR